MPKRQSTADSVSSARMMNARFAPIDFNTPISRVRSITVVYIVRKMTSRPIETASATIERANGIAWKDGADFVHHVVGVLGARAFQQKDRRFVARADQFLQRYDRNE